MMQEDLAYLQEAHAGGVLVPVVGAGLSSAAAGLPSWPALLDRGLRYAVDRCGVDPHDPRLADARNRRDAGQLTSAFDVLQQLLGVTATTLASENYRAFLADIFHQPTVNSTDLLDALRFLQPRRVITTNYDLLLEEYGVCGPDSVTWEQPAAIRHIFRLGSGVVHLHGRWDLADSVVLSQRDYIRIGENSPATAIAQAIFHSGVLMFVGTSLDGTHDPHLGDLLASFEALSDPASSEPAPHVILLRGPIDGLQVARVRSRAFTLSATARTIMNCPHSCGQLRIRSGTDNDTPAWTSSWQVLAGPLP